MIEDKIALFAFRKSQKRFFDTLMKHCASTHILFSQHSIKLALRAIKFLSKADFSKACYFAVEEFPLKSRIRIPRILLSMYFQGLARIHFLRYYAVLDKQYTKMLIWNGGKFRERIAIEVANILNIKVYYFENGLLPHTTVFDSKGINYFNSVPREALFYQNYHSNITLPKSLVPRKGKGRKIFKGNKRPLPDSYIFVPFQVDSDTQIIMQSPWIKDMNALFEIIEQLSQSTNYHFVLKEHPSSGIKYPHLHQKVKDNTQIYFHNSHSTQNLIEQSLAVITINSTVGIESLLFHKKVIVLGQACYAIEGISLFAPDSLTLEKILKNIENHSINEKLIDNFLKYLYNTYLIHKNDDYEKEICKRLLA